MTDTTVSALLYRLNENINAIGAAAEELAIWIEQRGSTETALAAKSHLDVLVSNADLIANGLAELIAREAKTKSDVRAWRCRSRTCKPAGIW
ncbi:hypothetical protein IB260_05830 [Pseudomonas sp. PDM23]|uniref:hypothetical protein n=1 Tax=unclassified Pseudomonas TaxID=196821 RepID=UPI00177FAFAB|nr:MULTISPECIES: hypothetical protein [unclassified Pseudomonas]MBD9503765.1 hypothetical protein [Pseudomonas sp. PDM17]MBD9513692.1 hypothetical protein [Pseudomonas sp. PDM22]MBD9574823.1 hypothetical protein [Pseudomonas sp. PDM23]MBD9630003.1 hypothetical protein [Pseudomonas sp. PDM19]MBD9672974.1 hypothetical protein [Pseudomonas sp. PDM21]